MLEIVCAMPVPLALAAGWFVLCLAIAIAMLWRVNMWHSKSYYHCNLCGRPLHPGDESAMTLGGIPHWCRSCVQNLVRKDVLP